jgi:hypothetical protein
MTLQEKVAVGAVFASLLTEALDQMTPGGRALAGMLTGSQESPLPIARQPGRAGSERLGERVESRSTPPG